MTSIPVGVRIKTLPVSGSKKESTARVSSAAEQIVSVLRLLVREEIAAASPEADPLIPHNKTPFGTNRTLRLIHAGKLRGRKIGKVYYIRQSAIDALAAVLPVDTDAAEESAAEDEIDAILFRTVKRRK